jgi:hypothetical protein
MIAVKTFGTEEMLWRGNDDKEHVIVATKGSAWEFICRATPDQYVTWNNADNPPAEESTTEPLVWKHDRAKVTCEDCVAVLDGAVVTRTKVAL